jgi:hypothetical protein
MDLIKSVTCNICFESIDHHDQLHNCSKCVFISHNICITPYFERVKKEMCPMCKNIIENNEEKCYIKYYSNGKIRKMKWMLNGELHRKGDLPAIIEYYENGSVRYESWCINGEIHREGDRPAVIYYNDNNGVIGSVELEEWWINGVRSREREGDRPAVIFYNEDKSVRLESWWINGLLNKEREGGRPAIIEYYKSKFDDVIENDRCVKQ